MNDFAGLPLACIYAGMVYGASYESSYVRRRRKLALNGDSKGFLNPSGLSGLVGFLIKCGHERE